MSAAPVPTSITRSFDTGAASPAPSTSARTASIESRAPPKRRLIRARSRRLPSSVARSTSAPSRCSGWSARRRIGPMMPAPGARGGTSASDRRRGLTDPRQAGDAGDGIREVVEHDLELADPLVDVERRVAGGVQVQLVRVAARLEPLDVVQDLLERAAAVVLPGEDQQ